MTSKGDVMGKVTVDISMSLDGFIAGPNDSVERPLGEVRFGVVVLTYQPAGE
jgi:hypothetical protein